MTICPDTWAMSVSPVASRLPEGAAWGLSSPSPMLHCVQGGDSHPKNYLVEQGSPTPEPRRDWVRDAHVETMDGEKYFKRLDFEKEGKRKEMVGEVKIEFNF